MARYRHVIFVCTNERPTDDPRGCCAHKGGSALVERLKELVAKHGLKGKVRVTRSGCLDLCAKGCAAVAFSGGAPAPETWYVGLGVADAEALFNDHVLHDRAHAAKVLGGKPG